MAANALGGWLQQQKLTNWQHRGKPICAAALWQDIAAQVESLVTKVHYINTHMPKSRDTEEHGNKEQVDRAARIEMAKVYLDCKYKGDLFIAQWAHDASGHLKKDAMYRWTRDRGVDLTIEAIEQVIHECEICSMIKQVKWVKLLCCGEQWLGKTVWVASPSGKSKPVCRVPFAQGPGRTWWVIQEDGETRCVPQGDLTLGENNL